MFITYSDLTKINSVQVNILREIKRVCDELNIKYFMVHGSLLGTIRNGNFVLGDDDIDIAMMRDDYDKFVFKGPDIIGKKFFIQTSDSEPDYSLEFAKVRDCETMYVTEAMQNLCVNHGIYIDIFPIDYKPASNISHKIYNYALKLVSLRLSNYYLENERNLRKIIRYCTRALIPTRKFAFWLRKKIIYSVKKSNIVGLTGGKPKEQNIPAVWFDDYNEMLFEGVSVNVIKNYSDYLTMIYGDYSTATLLENREFNEGQVQINAVRFDTENSYKVSE